MENTKVWAPIVVLGIILVGFFCFSYLEKVDKANASFQNSQLITEQAHQSLVARQQMLESRGRSAAENQTAVQRLKSADDRLKAAGFVIYAGQGGLSSEMFRIAVMGELTTADLERLLAAFPTQ